MHEANESCYCNLPPSIFRPSQSTLSIPQTGSTIIMFRPLVRAVRMITVPTPARDQIRQLHQTARILQAATPFRYLVSGNRVLHFTYKEIPREWLDSSCHGKYHVDTDSEKHQEKLYIYWPLITQPNASFADLEALREELDLLLTTTKAVVDYKVRFRSPCKLIVLRPGSTVQRPWPEAGSECRN